MAEILQEFHSVSPLMLPLLYAKFIQFFVVVARNYTGTISNHEFYNSKQKKYALPLMRVCEYILAHCTENLTLDEASAYAGFSKYHFSRIFKDFMGCSFYKYLNKKRMLSAQVLLIDPDLTVTEVALRSGYISLSTFIHMFKLCQGCTPSEYRSLHIR